MKKDLERRFPAWQEIDSTILKNTRQRLEQIAALIESIEGRNEFQCLPQEADAETAPAGTLVFNPKLGVALLCDSGAPRQFFLFDMSRHAETPVKYGGKVFPILIRNERVVLKYY